MQSRNCSDTAPAAETEGLPFDVAQLQAWLEPLAEAAQVECDGMSRLVSHLLHKNGIQHIVAGGMLVDMQRLQDPEVSTEESCGVTHWWLELGFGYIVDFRARMWMGPEAQHGVFIPAGGRFEYRTERRGQFNSLPEPILDLMAGVCVGDWSPFMPTEALERK
ncbi:hypothetical protein CAZ10_10480 [Pseudomonas aeruginosa]|uniref:Uncharacterized protein n=2 Tax=Pseudomonas TaxID=286 RepID=A0A241XS56_PSEAI|nr:hypothetical protein [Pseudomonas sp. S4_EA_1b]MBI6603313.1 hypothetical protein [Pseudomonas sp. S4_EA_1b]OBY57584.1 hypothetical protein A9513_002875 [Pseudomonas sp. AU12215]OTI63247.1 hypothetical protein CAZ10_10480 [Pseudomonas aeruginosa]